MENRLSSEFDVNNSVGEGSVKMLDVVDSGLEVASGLFGKEAEVRGRLTFCTSSCHF